MALFFFNLVSPGGFEVDEIGSELPNVEAAYLEARAAAVEISADMMHNNRDPSGYQFEIVDTERRFLMDFPFSELLRPRATSTLHSQIVPKVRAAITRGQRLRSEIQNELKNSKHALIASRAAMARSRKHSD